MKNPNKIAKNMMDNIWLSSKDWNMLSGMISINISRNVLCFYSSPSIVCVKFKSTPIHGLMIFTKNKQVKLANKLNMI